MGLNDTIFNAYRRRWHGASSTRRARDASEWSTQGLLFELASVDQTVRFYEDRLEYRRRLGSKRGVIPYSHVGYVRLRAKSSHAKLVLGNSTLDPSRTSAKVVTLILDSRRRPVRFDFRTEPLELVRSATDVIESGMNRLVEPLIDAEDTVRTASGDSPRSRADELATLAALRSAGVLTPEEFEAEKARILNAE